MRKLLLEKLKNSDIFTEKEIDELDAIQKWLNMDYIEELYGRDDVAEILDIFLYGFHQLEFTPDDEMIEAKRKYRRDYRDFFAKYEDLIGDQQSILVLYKPISVEYRHYFCFTDGFYIGGITNLTPIPKSKKKEVAKELLRVLLKNKSFRYKDEAPFEFFYRIKITPEELLDLCC